MTREDMMNRLRLLTGFILLVIIAAGVAWGLA